MAGGRGGGEVVRAVGRLRGRVGVGSGGGRRPIQGLGHGEAGPHHKLHQYKSNDPRGLEGLFTSPNMYSGGMKSRAHFLFWQAKLHVHWQFTQFILTFLAFVVW